jgi:hypothetical protein
MGFPLSVICSGRPIELDKPNIWALAAETGFLLFKEQVPLKFKKEISAVQCERKTFRLMSLSTPVGFRWTVPLRNVLRLQILLGRGGGQFYSVFMYSIVT